MKNRRLALLSTFLIALTLLCQITTITGAGTEETNMPTIFVNNEAWYKSALLPLKLENDEPLVPISFFSALNNISVSYNSTFECYLISDADGRFVSILPKTKRYLSHTGERGSLLMFQEEEEPYVSANTVAEILELGTEMAEFYGNKVLRVYKETHLQKMDILIDYYKSANASTIGTRGEVKEAAKIHCFSFFADLILMNEEELELLISATEEENITMTFAMPLSFIENRKNQKTVIRLASMGHTFAVKTEEYTPLSPEEQARLFNKFYYELLKNQTLLVLPSSSKKELKENGFVILDNSFRLSGTSGAASVNFDVNNMIFFDKINEENLAKFKDILTKARENGIVVKAINALAGN